MPGRRPYPLRVIETKKTKHYTKAELNERREREPVPGSSTLRCPGRLSVEEKKEWRRIVRLYHDIDGNLLSDLDSNLLEQYVVEWVRWKKAQDEIRKTSEVVRDLNNPRKLMANPWLEVERAASTVCMRIGSLLMLDVVSRAKMGAKKDPVEEDEMEKYMRTHS